MYRYKFQSLTICLSSDDPLAGAIKEEIGTVHKDVSRYRSRHNNGFTDVSGDCDGCPRMSRLTTRRNRFVVRKCFVESCPNVAPRFAEVDKVTGQLEYLFRFFPSADRELCQKWTEAIGRRDATGALLQPKQQSIICSSHFSPGSTVPDTDIHTEGAMRKNRHLLETNWNGAVKRVRVRFYGARILPHNKLPTLFKLITAERIFMGNSSKFSLWELRPQTDF